MQFYELQPAYGRDYKSAKDVKTAFNEGRDFDGDHQLGFKLVNKSDLPKGCTVLLRYQRNTKVTNLKHDGKPLLPKQNPKVTGPVTIVPAAV